MANHSPDADALRSKREKRMLDAARGSNGPAPRSGRSSDDNGWDDEESPRGKVENEKPVEKAPPSSQADSVLVDTLKEENDRLREIITELRGMLEESAAKGGGGQGGQGFEEREREYEEMIEEKSEAIRTLHVKIQELEKQVTDTPPAPATPDQTELLALSDELERERCQIEQERRQLEADRMQLREDEEAMMRQMREMELQMAKERAELARQRNELQRLHSEIRHELEVAQRDAAVNERLKVLQRRHKEVTEGSAESDTPNKKQPPSSQGQKKDKEERGGSIIKRWFGGGEK